MTNPFDPDVPVVSAPDAPPAEPGMAARRFQALIENAADIILVLDRAGRLTYARPSVQRVPSTGIGLFGVQQIVVQHGGTVHVASTEGRGTTVTVTLPLDEAE